MTVPEDVLQREPYGPDLVAVIRADHSEAAAALAHLLDVRDSEERRELFRDVARRLSVHEAAEEAEVLPLLAGAEGDTKLRVLATMFDQAKATAPTRPHPHGPDRLGGLLATGPVLAVVDRFRDAGRRLITR